MVSSKNGAVGVRHLGADIRGSARSAPKYVHVDAVRAQCKRRAGIHLRHHLQGVPAVGKTAHGEVETTVGGAASCHGLCVLLLAIHIERHHLGARTAHAERYVHGLHGVVASRCDAVGDIETTAQ